MQFSTIIATIIITALGVSASPVFPPGRPIPPTVPVAPVINQASIACSSGSPFCCSPTDSNNLSLGTTCIESSTNCNAVAVCCNNLGTGLQTCTGTGMLIQPVTYDYLPL